MININTLDKGWKKHLSLEFSKQYFIELDNFLDQEIKNKKTIYPPADDILNAFHLTPFKNTKAIILGQDPYHGQGQAHGLCFSVKEGIKIPPSLRNIYKELNSDLKIPIPQDGNLENWAKSGVLLLNTVLTVEDGLAGSHRKKGWELFTNKVIEVLNKEKRNLVFILWGKDAQVKKDMIDSKKHLILEAAHPSPLSVRNFQNNKHFSKTNKYLIKNKIAPINWEVE